MPKDGRIFAVIAAAGSGSRMGPGLTKTMRLVQGESVLSRSLRPFLELSIPSFVTAPVELLSEYRAALAPSELLSIIEGGRTRAHSVKNALQFISQNYRPESEDIVLVHDGARCLVTRELIERVLKAACATGAAIPVVPVIDTIKQVSEDGRVVMSYSRNTLRATQTPQGFHWAILERAYSSTDIETVSDDAGLVERIAEVSVVAGDESNIKVTGPRDLLIADLLLSQQ